MFVTAMVWKKLLSFSFVYINRKEVKIVCIELSINVQDTPTTDSRGVLESISYASARKTS